MANLLGREFVWEAKVRGPPLRGPLAVRDHSQVSEVPRVADKAISDQVEASQLSHKPKGRAGFFHLSTSRMLEHQCPLLSPFALTRWQPLHSQRWAGVADQAFQHRQPPWSPRLNLWLSFARAGTRCDPRDGCAGALREDGALRGPTPRPAGCREHAANSRGTALVASESRSGVNRSARLCECVTQLVTELFGSSRRWVGGGRPATSSQAPGAWAPLGLLL